MGRSYAKLLVRIWANPEFRQLTAPAQRLYMLLVSDRLLTLAGVVPRQPRRWAKQAQDTTTDQIQTALDELTECRFVLVDDDTEEVLVRTFIRHDSGAARNRNIHKAIANAVSQIESPQLRAVAAAELEKAKKPHVTDRGEHPSEHSPERDGEAKAASSQQPATSNQQPAAATQTGSSSGEPELPAAAAAAVDIFTTHRVANEQPRSPARYADKIRREETTRHLDELATVESDDPVEIAVAVFGMTKRDAFMRAYDTGDHHR